MPRIKVDKGDLEKSYRYIECGGHFFHGEKAWKHMEEEAGVVVSIFIEKYIKPAIQAIEDVEISTLKSMKLNWTEQTVEISTDQDSYLINRV